MLDTHIYKDYRATLTSAQPGWYYPGIEGQHKTIAMRVESCHVSLVSARRKDQ